ncbi:MAG: 1-(5-phosphoribosyl)-5-[(5-phosphoribosylamino)methylideneamino]imidazole-4-carboxamide isomerase [Pseudomonadales bacterium]|nr:1-(5-phosphoribosyl)-5-[(5-phosphoribosylamino)methylideneamino]imidazole-4-carboxamide isomerase [Pseudomonadales bacterium]MBL6815907.1 1-(5-phosphoribosyl)-5-[(5-phosphoribosylamino)methylideneamino]imidazole-4-carboxamide isomerase [Pseudomonadales bacterium]
MLVIPAIDLKDGQCVRLKQGRMEDSTVFSDDPVEQARQWLKKGARRLHIVDLNGAFAGTPVNAEIVTAITSALPDLPVQIGGGIRNLEAARFYIEAGVSYIIIGTQAVKDPGFVREACEAFPGKVIIGLDAVDGMVATEGWADVSALAVEEVVRRFDGQGIEAVIYTDISRDGMMQGANLETTVELAERSTIPIIASGGIAKLADIVDLKAAARAAGGAGIMGAITGRAIYEGKLDLMEAQTYCDSDD